MENLLNGSRRRPAWGSFKPAVSTAGQRTAGKRRVEERVQIELALLIVVWLSTERSLQDLRGALSEDWVPVHRFKMQA